jgi:hypothetical protein
VALDGVDPVAGLAAPGKREDLVRGVIDGVEGQAEGLVLDEGEEAERAVLDPLEDLAPFLVVDARLDEGRGPSGRFDAGDA